MKILVKEIDNIYNLVFPYGKDYIWGAGFHNFNFLVLFDLNKYRFTDNFVYGMYNKENHYKFDLIEKVFKKEFLPELKILIELSNDKCSILESYLNDQIRILS